MSKDTSEPAFSFTCQGPTTGPAFYYGLSMRDYFAAQAMQSMCAEVARYDDFAHVAKAAYKMADAMLEARK